MIDRLLIMTNSYLPINGGLQSTINEITSRWIRGGKEIRILTNRYPRKLKRHEVVNGIPVERWLFLSPKKYFWSHHRYDEYFASFYLQYFNRLQLSNLVKSFRPEIINLHFPDCQIPSILKIQQHFSSRLVISLHGNDLERWFRGNKLYYEQESNLEFYQFKKILNQADVITACSNYLLDLAKRIVPDIHEKGRVIFNGIEPTRFASKVKHEYPNPYLFCWGRFVYSKGYDLVVKAVNLIKDTYPNVDLIMAGNGEDYQKFKKLALEYGIENRIKFLGWISPEMVITLLNGCTAAIVPSRQESFGISALEALAAGKPLISTRVGGIPEFTQGAEVVWVDPNPESIAKGIAKVLINPISGLSNQKNREIAMQYTWDRTASEYLRVFEQVEKV
jgi:glycosyltransferase involved in cell wall biosynthesis